MNKSQLIDALSARYEGNRKQAQHALESVLDTITREVAKGEKVAITGFGSFEKRVREARWVRNPQTGARIKAKKTAVPKFSAGADLKNVVSGAKKLPKLTLAAPAAAAKKADGEEGSAGQEGGREEGGTRQEGSARQEGRTGQEGGREEGSGQEGAGGEEGAGEADRGEEGSREEGSGQEGSGQEGRGEEGSGKEDRQEGLTLDAKGVTGSVAPFGASGGRVSRGGPAWCARRPRAPRPRPGRRRRRRRAGVTPRRG